MSQAVHRASSDAGALRTWTRGEWLLLCVLSVLTLFHIAASIGYLLRDGRLAISTPLFDDVGYLVDGLDRLAAFDQGGFKGLLLSFVNSPPHAPLLSVLSTVGQALTVGEAGAYVLSGVWVIATLVLAGFILSGAPALTRLGLLCAVLALPILHTVIGVFRPDIAWGLLTGATATLLATVNILQQSRLTLFSMGLLAGVALISKPTGMPAGMTVMAVAYLGAVAIAWGQHGHAVLPSLLKRTLLIALGAAIVSVPYYALAGQGIFDYIRRVMIAQRAIWQEELSLEGHLRYLFTPYLISSMLGWLWPSGAVVLFANGCLTVWRWRLKSDREPLLRWLCTFSVLVVAYLIPAISPVKNAFIGCLFYGTAVMVFLWNLRNLLEGMRLPPWIVAAGGLLIFAWSWRPGNIQTSLNPPMLAADAAHRALMPSVLKLLAHKDSAGPMPRLLVASVGPLFDTTIVYAVRRHGLNATVVTDIAPRNFEAVLQLAATADIVLVAEAGTSGQSTAPFPLSKFQDQLLEALDRDSQFKQVASYVDPNGRRMVAFAKPFIAGRVRVGYAAGFHQEAGPYQPLRLARYRGMSGEKATIVLNSDEPATTRMHLRCVASVNTQLRIETAGGATSQTVELPGGLTLGNFRDVHLPIAFDGRQPTSVTLVARPRAPVPSGFPPSILCETPIKLSERRGPT